MLFLLLFTSVFFSGQSEGSFFLDSPRLAFCARDKHSDRCVAISNGSEEGKQSKRNKHTHGRTGYLNCNPRSCTDDKYLFGCRTVCSVVLCCKQHHKHCDACEAGS